MDGVIVRMAPAGGPDVESGDEHGAVLVFVVLLMLALLVLAHGALLASLSELSGSRAAVRDLELEGAARWALAATLYTPPGVWMDDVAVWESLGTDLGPLGAVDTHGELRRLGPESWMVWGVARNTRGAEERAGGLAWSLGPLSRVTALTALVSVGPTATVTLGGATDATEPTLVRGPLPETACDPWLEALDEHFGAHPLSVVGALPDSASEPGLGLLDLATLVELAPVAVDGTGAPTPTDPFGACPLDAPWAWGDPDDPSGPCGDHLPMRAGPGDLTVDGGVGQGLLVVTGDLTFRNSARFYGMVVVGGTLALEGGAELEGMAIAGGGVDLGVGAALTASACWATRALAAQREVLGALVPVGAV